MSTWSKHIWPKAQAIFFLLLVVVFAARLSGTWMRWADLLIDFGREIYIPWRMVEGDVLYRDMHSEYGPFSYSVVALLFRWLGESLPLLAVINSLGALIFLAATYVFVARLAGTLAAVLSGAIFLVYFSFGRFEALGNYNWIFPYAMPYVHGVTLGAVILVLLQSAMRQPRMRYFACAGICYGWVLLTRMEVVLAATAAVFAGGFACVLLHADRGRSAWTWLAAFVAGTAGALLVFWAIFHPMLDVTIAVRQILLPLLFSLEGGAAQSPFYEWLTGTDTPGVNLVRILKATACVLMFAAAAYLANRVRSRSGKWSCTAIAGVIVLLSVPLFLLEQFPPLLFLGSSFTGVTALLLIGSGILFLLYRRHEQGWRYASYLMYAVFALVLLFKILLRPGYFSYGFVLGAPAGILLVAGLLGLPRLMGEKWAPGMLYAALIAGFLLVDLAWGYRTSSGIYRHKTVPVHSVRGEVMRGFPYHVHICKAAPLISDLVQGIDANIPRDATLTVLPEGITINYLARRKTPFPVQGLTPNVITRMGGDDRIIAMLEAAAPDYILFLPRPQTEYGVGLFGHDPRNGKAIMAWVLQHYTPLWIEGEEYGQPPPFRSAFLRRIDADQPATP